MFNVNGTLYVRQKEVGLMSMLDSNLVLIQGGSLFANEFIYFIY